MSTQVQLPTPIHCSRNCSRPIQLFTALCGPEETIFLRKCVQPVGAKRRSGNSSRAECTVFKYAVEAEGVSYEVCQRAFRSVLDIKRSKLRRKITEVEARDDDAEDATGAHLNRPHQMSHQTIQHVI